MSNRLLVAGSRSFYLWPQKDANHVFDNLSYTHDVVFHSIIHGAAKGGDTLGARWAEAKGYPIQVYPAQWEKYGKRAGFMRNQEMVNRATHAVILWDGVSKGTKHTLNLCFKQGVPVALWMGQP